MDCARRLACTVRPSRRLFYRPETCEHNRVCPGICVMNHSLGRRCLKSAVRSSITRRGSLPTTARHRAGYVPPASLSSEQGRLGLRELPPPLADQSLRRVSSPSPRTTFAGLRDRAGCALALATYGTRCISRSPLCRRGVRETGGERAGPVVPQRRFISRQHTGEQSRLNTPHWQSPLTR